MQRTMKKPTAKLYLRWWFCGLVGCLLTVACSNQPPKLGGLHQSVGKDPEFSATLHQEMRSGRLYAGYTHVLTADAVYKSLAYRQRYLQERTAAYYLGVNQQKDLLNQQKQAYNQFFEFIIVLYSEQPTPVKLGDAKGEWQVFLKDSDGDLLRPASVDKMGSDNHEVIFLKKYFSKLDHWAVVYKAKFPKLNLAAGPEVEKTDANQPSQNFQLIISGVQGRILLQWDSADLFFKTTNQLSLISASE